MRRDPAAAAARSVTPAGGTASGMRGLAMLRRPPVTVRPAIDATGSAVAISRALISRPVSVGKCERSRAAAPDTCGVAMDVPLRRRYPDGSPHVPERGTVERMDTPGAAR